jgi:hypothetical protein
MNNLNEGNVRAYLAWRLEMYEEVLSEWPGSTMWWHPETKLQSYVWPMLGALQLLDIDVERKEVTRDRWPWAKSTQTYKEPEETAILRTVREVLGR